LTEYQRLNIIFDIQYIKVAFDGDEHFKNTIGVTVLNDDQLKEVELQLDRYNTPYVLTKPFHPSQQVVKHLHEGGVIIKLKVHLNFEFERLILGFGDSIKVLQPRQLRNRIKKKLERALESYQ